MPATPSSIPFVRGQNVTIRLFQGGSPVYITTKNFKVEENATEANDPVNGEIRDRLDKVTNYYSFSCDVYENDTVLMDAYMEAQEAEDAQGLPLSQSAAVQKKMRDGTRVAYAMQEAKFGPWDYAPGERTATSMTTIKGRFRFWKRLPSI